jgi:hypothetical protein
LSEHEDALGKIPLGLLYTTRIDPGESERRVHRVTTLQRPHRVVKHEPKRAYTRGREHTKSPLNKETPSLSPQADKPPSGARVAGAVRSCSPDRSASLDQHSTLTYIPRNKPSPNPYPLKLIRSESASRAHTKRPIYMRPFPIAGSGDYTTTARMCGVAHTARSDMRT